MVKTLNFTLYQIGWLACVLGAAFSREWLGIAVALTLVGIHMCLTTDRPQQAKLLVMAWGVGIVVDSMLLRLGVYQFPGGTLAEGLPPLWMSVLWIQFATTLRYCLLWLSGRYVASSLLGFAGAPLAFLGGERIDAVVLLAPRNLSLLLLGLLWAGAIPLLVYLSDRISTSIERAADYRGFESGTLSSADQV